jgi:hypothetical protein
MIIQMLFNVEPNIVIPIEKESVILMGNKVDNKTNVFKFQLYFRNN